MCWARSFFSRMIDAQLATGATHDMRIFTGSALLAALRLKSPSAHAPARANFRKRMIVLPLSRGLRVRPAGFSSRTGEDCRGSNRFWQVSARRRSARDTVQEAENTGKIRTPASLCSGDALFSLRGRAKLQHGVDHGVDITRLGPVVEKRGADREAIADHGRRRRGNAGFMQVRH